MGNKILIIEDSLLLCQVLEDALRKEGFDVVIAHDGKGGFVKAGACRPDIILLDLVLPDVPGEQICRDLKKQPDTENTPVIMLTAKDSDADHVVGRVLGADAYIPKPFDLEHLLAQIRRLIAGFVLFVLCLGGAGAYARDANETQVPSGMDLIKVGEHSVYVARGTRVTQRGSQLVLEPPDEFIARRLLALEEEIAALKELQRQMLQRIEALSASVERLDPLKSAEADHGTE
ncbi:MAG: response regulator transcription factor [Candidatus Omnitrophica bacterium]|nr:response regulator transcription factor [Candidatus Omnitrophota bacterium]MDD5774569.1 response regulator transcription factor [Candidatus Omnitrophota bacterium]